MRGSNISACFQVNCPGRLHRGDKQLSPQMNNHHVSLARPYRTRLIDRLVAYFLRTVQKELLRVFYLRTRQKGVLRFFCKQVERTCFASYLANKSKGFALLVYLQTGQKGLLCLNSVSKALSMLSKKSSEDEIRVWIKFSQ